MSKQPAADGGDHHLLIDGRRWRKSDPSIPEKLRSELVHELMDARRAVSAAKRAASASGEKAARARVQDAKLALGERGHPYWEAPDDAVQRKRAAASVRALLVRRAQPRASAAERSVSAKSAGSNKDKTSLSTICPSDVARIIGGESWRSSMQLVREVAAEMVARGDLRALQRGVEVAIEEARGPIRFALK